MTRRAEKCSINRSASTVLPAAIGGDQRILEVVLSQAALAQEIGGLECARRQAYARSPS